MLLEASDDPLALAVVPPGAGEDAEGEGEERDGAARGQRHRQRRGSQVQPQDALRQKRRHAGRLSGAGDIGCWEYPALILK